LIHQVGAQSVHSECRNWRSWRHDARELATPFGSTQAPNSELRHSSARLNGSRSRVTAHGALARPTLGVRHLAYRDHIRRRGVCQDHRRARHTKRKSCVCPASWPRRVLLPSPGPSASTAKCPIWIAPTGVELRRCQSPRCPDRIRDTPAITPQLEVKVPPHQCARIPRITDRTGAAHALRAAQTSAATSGVPSALETRIPNCGRRANVQPS